MPDEDPDDIMIAIPCHCDIDSGLSDRADQLRIEPGDDSYTAPMVWLMTTTLAGTRANVRIPVSTLLVSIRAAIGDDALLKAVQLASSEQ